MQQDIDLTFKCGEKIWSNTEIDNLLIKLGLKVNRGSVYIPQNTTENPQFTLKFLHEEITAIQKIKRIKGTLFSIDNSMSVKRVRVAFQNANNFFRQLEEVCKDHQLNYNDALIPQIHIPQVPVDLPKSVMPSQLLPGAAINSPASLTFSPMDELKQMQNAFAILIKQKFNLSGNCRIFQNTGPSEVYCSFENEDTAKKVVEEIKPLFIPYKNITKKSRPNTKIRLFNQCFFEVTLSITEASQLYAHLLMQMEIPEDLNLADQVKFIISCHHFKQNNLKSQHITVPDSKDFFRHVKVEPTKDHLLILHLLDFMLRIISEKFSIGSSIYRTYKVWVDTVCKITVADFEARNTDFDALNKMEEFLSKKNHIDFDTQGECATLLNQSQPNRLKLSEY